MCREGSRCAMANIGAVERHLQIQKTSLENVMRTDWRHRQAVTTRPAFVRITAALPQVGVEFPAASGRVFEGCHGSDAESCRVTVTGDGGQR